MPKSVLILDDDAVLLAAMQNTFADAGYIVYTAQTIEQAQALSDQTDYALIDLRLHSDPGAGVRFIDWMIDNRPDCRCILMSAHQQDLEAISDRGYCHTILKQGSPAQLLKDFNALAFKNNAELKLTDLMQRMNKSIDRMIESKTTNTGGATPMAGCNCGQEHGRIVEKTAAHEKAIDGIWAKLNELVAEMRGIITKQAVIFGIGVGLQLAITIGLQFYFNK